MGESSSHIRLVDQLVSWILHQLLDGDDGYMMIDHPNSKANERPPKIGGFIPDVYVPSAAGKRLIIGEAKTGRDLERKHSLDQLVAFLRVCSQAENPVFVLAVPWDMVRLAQAIMIDLRNRAGAHNVNTNVLEKLSG